MHQQAEMPNLFDPFGTWRAVRDASLQGWSRMMIDLVNSEAYGHATSQWVDISLTISQPFRHITEMTMTQVLTALNMPMRSDVTSLAGRLTNVETRLDDLDGRLDAIQHAVETLSASPRAADPSAEAREIYF